MSWAWPYPSDVFSLALSAYGRADGSPDKVLGIDMSTGARNEKKKQQNEKKKDRSKRKQPTSQPARAAQQVHVVLWDEAPGRDPQENDTDLEPDLVRANPIGTSYVTASSSGTCRPFGPISRMCPIHVRADGTESFAGRGLEDSCGGRAMWKGGDEPSQSECQSVWFDSDSL